jgi:hypothetical protein
MCEGKGGKSITLSEAQRGKTGIFLSRIAEEKMVAFWISGKGQSFTLRILGVKIQS